MIPKEIEEWSGQVFVYGKHRLIIFKTCFNKSSLITSLEHSEHFRG